MHLRMPRYELQQSCCALYSVRREGGHNIKEAHLDLFNSGQMLELKTSTIDDEQFKNDITQTK